MKTEIIDEPYTIQEALKALEVPLMVLLRITASEKDKHHAALEMLTYANIIAKWATIQAISTENY